MNTGSQIHGIQISPHQKNDINIRISETKEEIDIKNDHYSVLSDTLESVPVKNHKIRYTKEMLLVLDSNFTLIEDLPGDIKRVNLPKPRENRWISPRLDEDKDEKTQITMTFRRILNQITYEKYNDLLKKLLKIKMTTDYHFHTLISLIIEKATTEPKYSDLYAQLCIDLKSFKHNLKINPLNYLVNQCGVEFKKCLEDDNATLSETLNEEEKELRELKLLNEKERRIGLMKFIAELYKKNVLSSVRILDCMDKLFKLNNEDSLEQCQALFLIAGPILTKSREWPLKEDEFIKNIEIISKSAGVYPTRLRFKYQDLLDLIDNDWMPRPSKVITPEPKKQQDQSKSKQTPSNNDNEWINLTKGNKIRYENKAEKKVEELKSSNPFDLLNEF